MPTAKNFHARVWQWLYSKVRRRGYRSPLSRWLSSKRKWLYAALTTRAAKYLYIVGLITTIGIVIKRDPKIPIYETIFDNLEPISLGSAGIIFLLEGRDRRKRDHYEAWQVINSAQGQTGSGGRIQALEDLVRDGVDLEGVSAPKADLSGINLHAGRLRRANLTEAHLENAYLENAYLKNANLRGAHLTDAHLVNANLTEAHLENAHLMFAHLENAYLENAHLENANLRGAHLRGANLRGANLESTNLQGANLQDANLQGANLQDANLQDANLEGADLTGTILENSKFEA